MYIHQLNTRALIFLQGVRIYSVQCQSNAGAEAFYKDLAKRTFGSHLKLDQFNTIMEMFMAICYREHGAEFLSVRNISTEK